MMYFKNSHGSASGTTTLYTTRIPLYSNICCRTTTEVASWFDLTAGGLQPRQSMSIFIVVVMGNCSMPLVERKSEELIYIIKQRKF